MRELVDIAELHPVIEDVIKNGGTFRLYPKGHSMEPMLIQGEDSVVLGSADSYNVGDVLFYQRESGQYVIHRLIAKADKSRLTMCGDHQLAIEYGLDATCVIAKVIGYYKGEVYHDINEPEYVKYAKKCVSRFPFYRRNEKVYKFLHKCKRFVKKS